MFFRTWKAARRALLVTVAAVGSLRCAADDERHGVPAVVDPTRAVHYFDLPFPSKDLLRDDGTVDLSGFPTAGSDLLGGMVEGWRVRAELATDGFAANSSVYFRFEDRLPELPSQTAGRTDDPVVLVDVATGELFPVDLRFVDDPYDDPFYGPHTLVVTPGLGHTPPSGATLAVVVMRSAGSARPDGYEIPEEATEALRRAGLEGEAAVATTYQVGPATEQIEALLATVDRWVAEEADWSDVELRRVLRIEYGPGTTPGGAAATLCTATLEDGSTSVAYLSPEEGPEYEHELDLLDGWPMAVYQAELSVPYFLGLSDRPYCSAGFGMIFDVDLHTGWLRFDAGELVNEPEVDRVRIVVSLPLDPQGEPRADAGVILWDHGDGGTAYNHVLRASSSDDTAGINGVLAEAGYAVIGRDGPLYGTRYPMVDEGFDDPAIAYINLFNLPAARDLNRQSAAEGHAVRRFVEGPLNDLLPAGSVDSSRLRRLGHSRGSWTGQLAAVGHPAGQEACLFSGGGAYQELDLFLAGIIDEDLLATASDLLDIEVAPDAPVEVNIAAALGIETPEAQERFYRDHPVMMLMQWLVDTADPSTFARDEALPVTMVMGAGDRKVPNLGTEALMELLPEGTLIRCEPTSDYDPHVCLFREPTGLDAIRDWLGER